jgi:hypothetical protein
LTKYSISEKRRNREVSSVDDVFTVYTIFTFSSKHIHSCPRIIATEAKIKNVLLNLFDIFPALHIAWHAYTFNSGGEYCLPLSLDLHLNHW